MNLLDHNQPVHLVDRWEVGRIGDFVVGIDQVTRHLGRRAGVVASVVGAFGIGCLGIRTAGVCRVRFGRFGFRCLGLCRVGFRVVSNRITDGKCPDCGTAIPGIWSQQQALSFHPTAKA